MVDPISLAVVASFLGAGVARYITRAFPTARARVDKFEKGCGQVLIPPAVRPTLPKLPIRSQLRIAVSGYAGAGKTAFLTSLIAHLRQHAPGRFMLTDSDARITKAQPVTTKNRSGKSGVPTVWADFPFDQYFASIAHEYSWPRKGTDCFKYSLDVDVTTWVLAHARLTFYDLPGERFADAAMLHLDYAQWSAQQLQWLGVVAAVGPGQPNGLQDGGLKLVREYLELARDNDGARVSEPELIGAYKRALAEMFGSYHQYISPSFFALDDHGSTVGDDFRSLAGDDQSCKNAEVAKRRCSGLRGSEFAPLPPRFWAEYPDLVKSFEAKYNAYQHEIVLPIFKQLAECDAMVILVNWADILAVGSKALHDAHQFLATVLDALRPGGNVFMAMLKRFRLSRGIQRIAVAASQCDRFHQEDEDKLKSLTEKLAKPLLSQIPGVNSEYFACAAVQSAHHNANDKDTLSGRVYHGRDGEVAGSEECYQVDRIPENWDVLDYLPAGWDPQQFCHIPLVWPPMQDGFRAVPGHINLDKVFRFVTGW